MSDDLIREMLRIYRFHEGASRRPESPGCRDEIGRAFVAGAEAAILYLQTVVLTGAGDTAAVAAALERLRRQCRDFDPNREGGQSWRPTMQVEIAYTNHRGERSVRRIVPGVIFFGRSWWHPEPQWLLRAYDVGKKADRDFAMADIHGWRPVAEGEGRDHA